MIHLDYQPASNCVNLDTYGTICVKCGRCGRKFKNGVMVAEGMPKREKVISFAIEDSGASELPHPEINGEIIANPQGIGIRFDGFGTFDMDYDAGPPVYIEFHNGELRVYIWRNRDDQEPVKIVLNGARIVNRNEDEK